MFDDLDKYLDQFKKEKKTRGDDSVARVLDDEFAKLGYGDTARLSILGDVGRENSWDRNTIFGGHADPKNQASNRGIISWQGDRRRKLDDYLKGEGVLGRGDDDELRGMARFMDRELQSKEFAPVRQKLLNAKGTYEASEALRKYIKYVPGGQYNSYDPEFRVKNNADWAKRAKSLGLAQSGLDDYLDNLAGAKGGGLDNYLDQFVDKGVAPSPTNPSVMPSQLKPLMRPEDVGKVAEQPITIEEEPIIPPTVPPVVVPQPTPEQVQRAAQLGTDVAAIQDADAENARIAAEEAAPQVVAPPVAQQPTQPIEEGLVDKPASGQASFTARVDPDFATDAPDKNEGVFRQAIQQWSQETQGRKLARIEEEALVDYQKTTRGGFVFSTDADGKPLEAGKGEYVIDAPSATEYKQFLDSIQPSIADLRMADDQKPVSIADLRQADDSGVKSIGELRRDDERDVVNVIARQDFEREARARAEQMVRDEQASGRDFSALGDSMDRNTPEGVESRIQAETQRIIQDFDNLNAESRRILATSELGGADFKLNPTRLVPFISSIVEAKGMRELLDAANRLKEGKADQLDLARLRHYAAQESADKSTLYQIFDVMAQAPAFMGEMLATSGIYTGVKQGLKTGAFKLLKKLATKEGLDALESQVPRSLLKAGKFVGEATATVAASVPQTAAGAPFRIAADTYRNQLPEVAVSENDARQLRGVVTKEGDDLGTALKRAAAGQFGEFFSEHSGGALAYIPVPKRLQALKAGIAKWWLAAKPGRTVGGFVDLVKKAGWHGPIGEMFEERVANVYDYARGEAKSPIPTLEQLVVEGVSFTAMGGVFKGIQKVQERLNNQTEQLIPQTQMLSVNDSVKPGTPAIIQGIGEGVVVQDRGTTVLVNHDPKTNEDGETVYQSQTAVWKDRVHVPIEPVVESQAIAPETPKSEIQPAEPLINETQTPEIPEPAAPAEPQPLVSDQPLEVPDEVQVAKPSSTSSEPSKPRPPIKVRGLDLTAKEKAETQAFAPSSVETAKDSAKEPWQMTQGYVTQEKAKTDFPIESKVEVKNEKPVYTYGTTVQWDGKPRTFEIEGRSQPTGSVMAERLHKKIVEAALSEGKPVPPEVLADYPDLQKPYNPAAEIASAINMDAVTPENVDQIAGILDKIPDDKPKRKKPQTDDERWQAFQRDPDAVELTQLYMEGKPADINILREIAQKYGIPARLVNGSIQRAKDERKRLAAEKGEQPKIRDIADASDGKVIIAKPDTGTKSTPTADLDMDALFEQAAGEKYGKTPEQKKKDDAVNGLIDAFGFDDVPLKSVLADFDEQRYEGKIKGALDNAFSTFDAATPAESMRALLDALESSGLTEKHIREMKPYIVRFAQEKFLQSDEKGSIEEVDDTDGTKPERDGQDSDAAEGAADVQGTRGGRKSGSRGPRKGKGGTGNVSTDAESSDRPDSDLERPVSGESPAGESTDALSEGNSDRPSHGIPNRKPGHNDYLAPVGSLTREGSWKDAAKTNLDIIELVKRLEVEGRLATSEEQQLLVKFTGWGSSELAQNLFGYYPRAGWEDLHTRVKELLDDAELETAKRSTQYAHYTSEKIIRGVWDAFNQFGFKQGRILEPGMGVGLFAVAGPRTTMENSRYTGIEMDHMTARIAKQILQNQHIEEGDYVKTKLPDNFFDVAIGNPPFADIKILDDPKYKKYRFRLHDYFFAKSIDKVRPGGLLVFVTSKGTMDKADTKTREYIAERADLLGAIRLPQTAFKQNAGTEVVTDVIFLRKRLSGEEKGGQEWIDRGEITGKNDSKEDTTGLVNQYFIDHPEMVLGQHAFTGSMYRSNEYTVTPRDGDIEQHFAEAVKKLPKAIYAEMAEGAAKAKLVAERDWSPKTKKEGSLYIHDDGRLMRRESGSGVQLSTQAKVSPSEEKWLRGYIDLRNALKQAQYDQLHAEDSSSELISQRTAKAKEHIEGMIGTGSNRAERIDNFKATEPADLKIRIEKTAITARVPDWAIAKALSEIVGKDYTALVPMPEVGSWEKSLAELNKVYTAFVKKHGNILAYSDIERKAKDTEGREITKVTRRFKNNRLLGFDVENALVWSLERITEDGEIIKSKMLSERQIKPPQPPQVRGLSDALSVSLDQTGTLNLDHVVETMKQVEDMTREEVILQLGDSIYEDPSKGWQMADEYLSGYVKDKLADAQTAAKADKRFERNVDALLKAQPTPLLPANIQAGLGSPWIEAKYISQFAQEELEMSSRYGDDLVKFDPLTNHYTVEGASGTGSQSQRSASKTWGTAERSPEELLEAALNNKVAKITETVWVDGSRRTVTNDETSAAANEIIKNMRDGFKRWIWSDGVRARDLAGRYNELMNNIGERQFNGDHLTTPGLSTTYKLHSYQKRVVWRQIQTGNTYLAHAVGAGKTLEMIVGAMEQKRLGLISKPMFVVPNHMLKQFASEFLEAYPMAHIMVADEQNFHKDNRRRFVAQAALNDLDAVIVTHSSFGLIRAKPESSQKVVDGMIEMMSAAIIEIEGDGGSLSMQEKRRVKELEKRIEQIERRFGGLVDDTKRDDVVDFEDMGIDMLYVDEAHEFRKLDFVTNRENTKGIDAAGSQKALDLLIKARYLNEQRPGRAMVMASGTPITNTLAELYSIQRFMDPQELEDSGLAHFDAWAAQFGEAAADYEPNAAGNLELVERFSRFVNIPELMKRVRKFMDVLTRTSMGGLIDLPTVKGGKPEVVVVEEGELQKRFRTVTLANRIEESKKWRYDPDFPEQKGNPDPIINIITDGRLAAIDARFVVRGAPNDPGSKLNKMIDSVIENYHEHKDNIYTDREDNPDPVKGGTQLVFSSVGFGEQVAKSRGFDAKGWIRQRLIEGGVKESEIAFMSDYKTNAAKEAMFREMRQGSKRVLIGSPKNMGTGVNVQKRIVASHFLSPPWYPADVEQPDGRSIRQGNQNAEVYMPRYATKGTYDSTTWQMVARKSRSIEQAMNGDDSQRTLEDVSESSLYDLAAALSSGDSRTLQLAKLRHEIEKLQRLRGGHQQEQQSLESEKRRAGHQVKSETERLARIKAAIEKVGDFVSNEEFNITVAGETLGREHGDKSRVDIGDAIKPEWAKAFEKGKLRASIGETTGIEIGKVQGQFPLIAQTWHSYTFDPSREFQTRLAMETGDVHHNLSEWTEADPTTADSTGIATRIYNALNSLGGKKTEAEDDIVQNQRQLKQIESKIGQPFADEQELFDKIAEFSQLQAEMASEGVETKSTVTPDELEQILLVAGSREDSTPEPISPLSSEEVDMLAEAYHLTRLLEGPLKSVLVTEPNAFYSRVEKVIEDKMPPKAQPAQITALLLKNSVKELDPEYQMVRVWLEDQGGSVSKVDVLEFVRANRVEVQESVLGTGDSWAVYEKHGGAMVKRFNSHAEATAFLAERDPKQEHFELRSNDFDRPMGTVRSEVKFPQIVLPGESSNYREEFVTAPTAVSYFVVEFGIPPKGMTQTEVAMSREKADEIAAQLKDGGKYEVRSITEKKLANAWKDGHSSYNDVSNPVVRMRYNDRTTTDGDKMLFTEEIQQPSEGNFEKMPKVYQKYGELIGIKKMLYRAAAGGYDYLGLTTGKQQADRYSLEKDVESIDYQKKGSNLHQVRVRLKEGVGGKDIIFETDGQGKIMQSSAQELVDRDLSNAVGKDNARKILEGNAGSITGDGLKIGGASLAGRYDKGIVGQINKYLKPWGVQVEMKEVTVDYAPHKDGAYTSDVAKAEKALAVGAVVFGRKGPTSFRLEKGADLSRYEKFEIQPTRPVNESVYAVQMTSDLVSALLGDKQPLFSKLGEDIDDTEKMTVEEMRDLPYVSTDEILAGAEMTRRGDLLKMNAKSHELLRRSFEEARIRKARAAGKKIRPSDFEDPFGGVFLPPEAVSNTLAVLRDKANEARELGYTDEEVGTLTGHADMLEAAAKDGKGTAVLFILDRNLPGERFHQADYLGAAEKTLLDRHTPDYKSKLDSHPVKEILWKRHYSNYGEYTRIKSQKVLDATLRAEIPTYLIESSEAELAAMGITPEMRNDYMLTWFEGYAAKNGIESLDNFDKEELDVKEFIAQAKEALSRPEQTGKNGKGNEADRGLEREPQGKDPPDRRGDSGRPIGNVEDGIRLTAETHFGRRIEKRQIERELGLDKDTRLRSLPLTLRRAGIDAIDESYEVFHDPQATEMAADLLEQYGVEGSIDLLRTIPAQSLDAHHGILSFMIIKALQNHAASIREVDPETARKHFELSLQVAQDHAKAATQLGRFTRVPSIVGPSVETLKYAVQGIIEAREQKWYHKTLSAEAWEHIEGLGRNLETALTTIEALRREKRNQQAKIKRLEDEQVGKRRRRKSTSNANRKRLVDLIQGDKKRLSSVEDARVRLLAKFAGQVEALKSVLAPNTDAFKNWFRESKVVDEKTGEPLVVYHGTTQDFDTFDPQKGHAVKGAIFATDSTNDASAFAHGWLKDEHLELDRFMPPHVMPIFMRLENPKSVDAQGALFNFEGVHRFIQEAKSEGFDGVIIRNIRNMPNVKEYRKATPQSTTYVAFEPTQIKSAIGNRGTFSPDDPSILKSVLPEDGLDADDLNDFSEVGAMMLIEGLAGDTEYLPSTFKAEMLSEFGSGIEPYFDQIYKAAWDKRTQWLNEIRYQETKERVENKYNEGEELEDWQINEILGTEKMSAKRRRFIERYHEITVGAKKPKRNIQAYRDIIAELTKDKSDAVALGALVHAEGLGTSEIHKRLSALGLTDAEMRNALRQGYEVWKQAQVEFKKQEDAVANEILAAEGESKKIDDLMWKARNDLKKSQQVVADEMRRIKNGEGWYRLSQLTNTLNASRTLMASFDLSAALRQGGFFAFASPENQKKAFANMFKSIGEKGYGQAVMELEAAGNFILSQRSGIDYAIAGKTDEGSLMGEELFRGGDTIKSIPGLGPVIDTLVVGWSERTYTAFLDTQRFVMFDVFAKELMDRGLTYQSHPQEFKKIADFINIATGRGLMPSNKYAKLIMDLPLFAPRYTLSRLQLLNMTLNPVAYANMPPAARRIVAKNAVRFYGSTMGVLGLVTAFGAAIGMSVNWDPDDPDFLKIKIGNTYYDILSGLGPPAKLIIKIVYSAIRTKGGFDNRLPGEFGNDVLYALGRFTRGKLSPTASLATDFALGSDYIGEEFKADKALVSRITPLLFSELYQAYKLDGTVGVARTAPFTIFGVGVSNYKDRPERSETEAEKFAAKAVAYQMSSRPQTAEDKQKREVVQDLTARGRNGEDIFQELDAAVDAGTVTEAQKRNIIAARTKSYLVDKAEGLSLENIETAYRLANDAQRRELLPLLNNKMKEADINGKLQPEQRKALEAIGARIPGEVTMPESVKKAFDDLDIPIPDVGESLTLKKGGNKTRLSTDQYDKYRREALEGIYGRVKVLLDPSLITSSPNYQKAPEDLRRIMREGAEAASKKYQEASPTDKEKILQRIINKARNAERKETKLELATP